MNPCSHHPTVACLIALFGLVLVAAPKVPVQAQESSQDSSTADANAGDESAETGLAPVAPQDLFAAMPGKMKAWQLTRSTAERRYGSWLESRAVREFERQLPPKKGAEPGPPAKTRIAITDTGRHAAAIAPFADFVADEDRAAPAAEGTKKEDADDAETEEQSEAEEDAGFERKYIDGHPAFVFQASETEHDIEMLVDGRYIVHLIAENQPERFVKEWLRRLDLRALASIPDTEGIELPEEIVISRIDQLKPKRNQAYLLATSSGARVSQELAEDENWLKQTLGEIPELGEEDESAEPSDGDSAP